MWTRTSSSICSSWRAIRVALASNTRTTLASNTKSTGEQYEERWRAIRGPLGRAIDGDWHFAEAGDWRLAEAGDWHFAEAGDWRLAGAGDWQPRSCCYLMIFNVIYGYHTHNKIMYNMDEYLMYNPSPFRFKASLRFAVLQHIL